MEKKKINIKKIIYILLIVVLAVIFVSSLVFGSIAAFTETLRDNIEVWYTTKFEKDISLLKVSITWLIISSLLLIFTLSLKDLKKKYIDQ